MGVKAVLIASVHHTGSWWLVTQLINHPEITAFAHNWSVGRLLRGDPVMEGEIIIDGQHIKQSVATSGTQLLKTHIYQNSEIIGTARYPQFDTIIYFIPTLVPLRDPLLTLMSAHVRHAGDPCMDRIKAAEILMEWERMVNMAYLPFRVFRIDRDTTGDLLDAVRWMGLSLPEEWAVSVQLDSPRNSAGHSTLYDAYAAGDIKTIRRELPLAWSSLVLMQPVLRPFLERYGYEHLLWWD